MNIRSIFAVEDGEPAPKATFASTFELDGPRCAAAWGAVAAVLEVSVDSARRRALLAFGKTMLELSETPAEKPSPSEVALAFQSGRERTALVHALIVAACLGGEVSREGEAAVKAFAAALGVRSPWVRVLGAMRRRAAFAVKRALMRNAPDARRVLSRTWHEEGVIGVGRAVLFVLGLSRDPALARRFCELADLPEDSFGARFFHHIRSRGLAFPGEKGGVPERMVHHDLLHVLTGYDTDGAGECELAGFYAAFSVGDPFTFIMIALATFQLGMAVSPAAVTPTVNAFDVERVARAYLRGRRLRVDVMGRWDYWQLMPRPLSHVQRELGIANCA